MTTKTTMEPSSDMGTEDEVDPISSEIEAIARKAWPTMSPDVRHRRTVELMEVLVSDEYSETGLAFVRAIGDQLKRRAK